MRLSDEDLRGRTVIGADGHAIGEVAALFLDSSTWAIESIQIKLRNAVADRLGATRTIFTSGAVEIPVGFIQSVGDAVVLTIPTEGLRQVLPSGAKLATAQH